MTEYLDSHTKLIYFTQLKLNQELVKEELYVLTAIKWQPCSPITSPTQPPRRPRTASTLILINTESYVDRSARRVNRAAWKQSQCVASGQTATSTAAAGAAHGGGQSSALVHFGNQHTLPRPSSALSHSQQSSVSISSGSVSSIASSLATSGATGKQTESTQHSHHNQTEAMPRTMRNNDCNIKILDQKYLHTTISSTLNTHRTPSSIFG